MKYYDSEPECSEEPIVWFDDSEGLATPSIKNMVFGSFKEAKKHCRERLDYEINEHLNKVDLLKSQKKKLKTMKASDVNESDNPFYN